MVGYSVGLTADYLAVRLVVHSADLLVVQMAVEMVDCLADH